MTDLLKLAERVEAGDMAHKLVNQITSALYDNNFNSHHLSLVNNATRNGSLDSAQALHDAVLPGWSWEISEVSTGHVCTVWSGLAMGEQYEGQSKSSAAAWVSAILRAKHSEGI